MSLERETVGGVCVLRLARPPVNALDLPTILSLERAFQRLADERPVGLVLSGAGGVFSATGATDIRMMDNLCFSHNGDFILVQEDVGDNARLGRVWLYDLAADRMTEIGIPDASRFLMGGSNFLTQDEETSGIIDAWDLLGPGWFLLDMQAHYTTGMGGELVQGGQVMALYIPQTVPTPGAAALMGLAGLAITRRRR